MPMMTDLAGKTCVLTGATSGIGEAAVAQLARNGARIVGLARNVAGERDAGRVFSSSSRATDRGSAMTLTRRQFISYAGAGGAGANGGFVDAWIDFNGNGSWLDPGEQIQSGWLPQGANNVGFTVPAGSMIGQTFGRFRINSLAAGLAPTGGPAVDGTGAFC